MCDIFSASDSIHGEGIIFGDANFFDGGVTGLPSIYNWSSRNFIFDVRSLIGLSTKALFFMLIFLFAWNRQSCSLLDGDFGNLGLLVEDFIVL